MRDGMPIAQIGSGKRRSPTQGNVHSATRSAVRLASIGASASSGLPASAKASVFKALVHRWASNHGALSRSVGRAAERYLRHFNNVNYDSETNGEYWLMRRNIDAAVIFDVGANKGDWSLTCASICRHATIHAFEISPQTFERLRARTVDNVRIIANPFGLSDTDGESAINVHPNNSCLTSLIAGVDQIHHCSFAIEKARVAIGDEYCSARAIEHIDLLKIDTEGAEHLVLGGFRRMLSEGRIKMIQFEYGMANLFSKFILHDFYLLLEPYGFAIGKLFPNRIDFRPWRPEDEDFRGPNFVAAAAGHRLLNS